jgi:uncharacterized repeat protein (TIGR01451 family)
MSGQVSMSGLVSPSSFRQNEQISRSLARLAWLMLTVLGGFVLVGLWHFALANEQGNVQAMKLLQPYSEGSADVVGPSQAVDSITHIVTESSRILCNVDLEVVKMVNENAPNPGETITYTITVTNHGPSDATGAHLADVLPPGIAFGGYTATQGFYSDTFGLWSIGDMANIASATLVITVIVDSDASGTITNTAEELVADQFDTNPDNNEASAVISVTVTGADLAVTKTVNNAMPKAGEVITYTITVINNGPDEATGARLTDVLPAGVIFSDYTAMHGTYTYTDGFWGIGDLRASEVVTLNIAVTVDRCTDNTVITNTASTAADQHDSNLGNNKYSMVIAPASSAYCYYFPIILGNYAPCLYYDFGVPEGDWREYYEDTYTRFGYVNGEYQMVAKDPSRTHLAWPNGEYENYIISATVRWSDALSMGSKYGLTYAIADDKSSFYTFMVYPLTQAYEIKYYHGAWSTLYSGYSSAITTSLASNHLSVERSNGKISIAANGTSLGSITATQISGQRHVGIGVGPYTKVPGNYDADARFDDYQICPLSGESANSRILSISSLQGGSVPGD